MFTFQVLREPMVIKFTSRITFSLVPILLLTLATWRASALLAWVQLFPEEPQLNLSLWWHQVLSSQRELPSLLVKCGLDPLLAICVTSHKRRSTLLQRALSKCSSLLRSTQRRLKRTSESNSTLETTSSDTRGPMSKLRSVISSQNTVSLRLTKTWS